MLNKKPLSSHILLEIRCLNSVLQLKHFSDAYDLKFQRKLITSIKRSEDLKDLYGLVFKFQNLIKGILLAEIETRKLASIVKFLNNTPLTKDVEMMSDLYNLRNGKRNLALKNTNENVGSFNNDGNSDDHGDNYLPFICLNSQSTTLGLELRKLIATGFEPINT